MANNKEIFEKGIKNAIKVFKDPSTLPYTMAEIYEFVVQNPHDKEKEEEDED